MRMPPEFLRGAAGPHPANGEKRYTKTLCDVGLWRDEEYLRRKETRTVADNYDNRKIFPCVLLM